MLEMPVKGGCGKLLFFSCAFRLIFIIAKGTDYWWTFCEFIRKFYKFLKRF